LSSRRTREPESAAGCFMRQSKRGEMRALKESVGFKHIDANRVVPSQYARADVYMELVLV
jgi:hypothetical protein